MRQIKTILSTNVWHRASRLNSRRLILIAGVTSLVVFGGMIALFRFIQDRPTKKLASAAEQTVTVKNLTDANSNVAAQSQVLKWQKQIAPPPGDVDAKTTSYEKILPGQSYQAGSLKLPPGWKAQWSTSNVADGANAVYSDTEPSSGVTFVKVFTDTVTTTQPVTQAPLTQPLDQERIASPAGASTMAAVEYNNRTFNFYEAVDVSDGLNDSNEMTIGCLDMKTYKTCSDYGVTFPTYLSSVAGTPLGDSSSTRDISTPSVMQYALDRGQYGNAGYLYMPAQRGADYGVNCVDLINLRNCGFVALNPPGVTMPQPNQPLGKNPTRISGFVQSNNRLYGNAVTDNGNADQTDDFMQIVCFDMQTRQRCSDYTGQVNSPIPSYYTAEHGNEYFAPSQNYIVGNKYFFLLNYDEKNARVNTLDTSYTQTLFGNRLVCYDVASQAPCSGWPSGAREYRAPVFDCGGYYGCAFYPKTQMVYGHEISEDAIQVATPRQVFTSKDNLGNAKGLCVLLGSLNIVDPEFRCVDIETGAIKNSAIPPGFLPTQWLNVPWVPAAAITEVVDAEAGLNRIYTSYRLPANNVWGGRQKSAVICYDWKTQSSCAGFRFPHYWYEIDQADSLDAAYIYNNECMIGASGYNFLWSFDTRSGETPCRKTQHTVNLKPSTSLASNYCDTAGQRNVSWARLQVNNVSLYDFKEVDIRIKNKAGVVLGSFNGVNIKDIGRLDLSSIPFSGNTDELIVDVKSTVWNASPWAPLDGNPANAKNLPLISVVMSGEPAQYCYETKVEPLCNISSVATSSAIQVITEATTLSSSITKTMAVSQPDDVQCFRRLTVTGEANQSRINADETVTYTSRVTNTANPDPQNLGTVRDPVVKITLPAGATVLSSTPGVSIEAGDLYWRPAVIQPGQVQAYSVTVRLGSALSQSKSKSVLPFIRVAQAAESLAQFSTSVTYEGEESSQVATGSASVTVVSPTATPTPTPVPTPTPAPGTSTPVSTPTPAPGTSTPVPSPGPPALTASPQASSPTPVALDGTTPRASASPTPTSASRANRDQENKSFNFFGATIPQQVTETLRSIPQQPARIIPFALILSLLLVAAIHGWQAWAEYQGGRMFKVLMTRYSAAAETNRNFISLISHYLNTPVNILQASSELLIKQGSLSVEDRPKLQAAIANLAADVAALLTSNQETSRHIAESNAEIDKVRLGTIVRSLHIILPITLCVVALVVANILLTEAGRYSLNGVMVLVQGFVLALSGVGLVVAYRSYRHNKLTRQNLKHQTELEAELLNQRTAFITKSYQALNADVALVKGFQKVLPKTSAEVKPFGNAIGMLEALLATFARLIAFSKPLEKLPAPISIAPVVLAAIERCNEQIAAKQLTVVPELRHNLVVPITHAGLEQVINSILDNAVTFSQHGGVIKIVMSLHAGSVRLVVEDTGVGIDEAKLSQIMTPFSRATDVLKYDYKGVGLSLYLDKLILEQIGGSLQIHSQLHKGTTVTLDFADPK